MLRLIHYFSSLSISSDQKWDATFFRITWFNESSLTKKEKDFTFRFRGQESLAYIRHFPSLISMLLLHITVDEVKVKIHQIFYCFLLHRRVISYTVRIENFDKNMQNQLEINASLLFKACCLFYPRLSVSLLP